MVINQILIFSVTEFFFFFQAQAFASPTDMASSSVKENIILAITPTFDGVYGMLLYIILNFVFSQI